ncbi:MAG: LLM class F420-dependent oxidoreductase [bacterium]|nr:LLM class F420-dependent oxidoreductase [bacterium]
MKLSTSLNTPAYSSRTSVDEAAAFVVEAERLGVDTVWTAEAWGTDAFTPLAHVAALTERIKLATGIVQISARAPVMTAMTAMTLDVLSGGRMVLGLGVSGPQVVEGLHGQRYDRPLERLREYVEVLRLAFAGERLEYSGNQTVLPLSGGEGKALRLALKPNPRLPIHLATLGPRAMELCGEIADGWVATCFVPERSGVYIDALARGAERAGRSLTEIAIDAGGPLAFSDDVGRLVQSRKKALAFQLSAMGSPKTNFYNMAYSRMGYEDVAQEVRKLWLDGKRDDAVAAVPDELAASTSLFGTREMVRDRMRAYRDAGVTTLRIDPMGREPSERLAVLEQAIDVAREVTAAI